MRAPLYKAFLSKDGQKLTKVEFMIPHSTLENLQSILDEEEVTKFNGIDEFTYGLPEKLGADL